MDGWDKRNTCFLGIVCTSARTRVSGGLGLLLHSTESLADLIVQLVKLPLDVLLGLSVGRLELHLGELVHDIAAGVADLSMSPDRSN